MGPKPSLGPWSCLFATIVLPLAAAGCSQTTAMAPPAPAKSTHPLALGSSADLGIVANNSEPIRRIIKIRNASERAVTVSHWKISCECLTVVPGSCEIGPGSSQYVALLYDPHKEAGEFTGSLLIAVEAYSADTLIGEFSVPISVVSAEEVAHLDALSAGSESPGMKP